MINKIQERFDNENRVLLTLVIDGTQVAELVKYISNEHFFKQPEANDLALWIKKFYESSPDSLDKFGNTADVYGYLIANGASEKTKKYLSGLITSSANFSSSVTTENMLRFLTEQNLESEIDDLWKQCPEIGYDKLEYLNNGLESILENFNNSSIFSEVAKTNEEQLQDFLEILKAEREGTKEINAIPTGIESLDKVLLGVPRDTLSIVAGRPSQGKTAFTLFLAKNWILEGRKVGYISLETDYHLLMRRWIASEAGIPHHVLQNPKNMNEKDFKLAQETVLKFTKDSYKFDCGSYHTLDSIKSRILFWNKKHGINIIFIDHLGLVTTDKGRSANEELGKVTRTLRLFAKEHKITIIVLSQLNRGVEYREDKRPTMADLRDSGNIEQDAEMILLMYWGAKYKDLRHNTGLISLGPPMHEIQPELLYEIIVGKNKSGETGVTYLEFLPQLQKFQSSHKGQIFYNGSQPYFVPEKKKLT